MCWSEEVSLATFAVSLIISIYLGLYRQNKNDIWHSVFLLTFSTMQLLEAFLWRDLTSCAGALVWPLVIILPLSCVAGRDIETKVLRMETVYTLLYCITGLMSFADDTQHYLDDMYTQTTVGSGGHLIWRHVGFRTKAIIIASYSYAAKVPYIHLRPYGKIFAGLGVLSAVLSYFYAEKNEFSSFWCHIANLYGVCALYLTDDQPKRSV